MLPRKKGEEIKAVEMPPIKEYLKEIQRDGSELGADEVLKDTLRWLDSRGMKNAVSMQMVEQYAFSVARWIHLERLISKYGYSQAPDHRCAHSVSVCSDGSILYETGYRDTE